MCSFCNRVSADNSNMNRHIEVKHAAELELYLMQPSEMNQLQLYPRDSYKPTRLSEIIVSSEGEMFVC